MEVSSKKSNTSLKVIPEGIGDHGENEIVKKINDVNFPYTQEFLD